MNELGDPCWSCPPARLEPVNVTVECPLCEAKFVVAAGGHAVCLVEGCGQTFWVPEVPRVIH